MIRTLSIIGILCLLINAPLTAHGDLSEQIERISKRIEKDSTNAKLYLKRGQLHAKHNDYDEAKRDYIKARELDGSLNLTDLLLAQLLSKFNKPDTALIYAEAFLVHEPNHPTALISRAGIYQQLGQSDKCQKDLELAMSNLSDFTPSHYIMISEAVLLADSSNVSEALNWLGKGEEEFGFDIVLKSKEVELYEQSGQFENAILTIDEITEHFPRKEKWFFQKALIYEKAGNNYLAKAQFEAALSAIENLPKRIKKTSKMVELKEQALEKLEQIAN